MAGLAGFEDITPILRSGVYALVLRGSVIYIGQAKNLYSRIYAHRSMANRAAKGHKLPSWLPVRGLVFDEVHVRPCPIHLLDVLEYEMINLYKPRHNSKLKTPGPILAPSILSINGIDIPLNRPASPAPIVVRRI